MIRAKPLRKEIGDLGFDFHVRVWKDAQVWVSPASRSAPNTVALVDRLTELGYRTERNGAPGTAGEFIIEVFEG